MNKHENSADFVAADLTLITDMKIVLKDSVLRNLVFLHNIFRLVPGAQSLSCHFVERNVMQES